jgi:hypothetical protein
MILHTHALNLSVTPPPLHLSNSLILSSSPPLNHLSTSLLSTSPEFPSASAAASSSRADAGSAIRFPNAAMRSHSPALAAYAASIAFHGAIGRPLPNNQQTTKQLGCSRNTFSGTTSVNSQDMCTYAVTSGQTVGQQYACTAPLTEQRKRVPAATRGTHPSWRWPSSATRCRACGDIHHKKEWVSMHPRCTRPCPSRAHRTPAHGRRHPVSHHG